MKKTTLLVLGILCMCVYAHAANYYVRDHGYWMAAGATTTTGTTNLFSDAANGTPGDPPINPMDGGATTNDVYYQVPRKVYIQGSHVQIKKFQVSSAVDAVNAILTISGNATFSLNQFLVVATSGRNSGFGLRLNDGSTMNVTGAFCMTGTTAYALYSAQTTVTQAGGTMNISAGTGLLLTGTSSGNANGTGYYWLQGGTLNVTGGKGIVAGLGTAYFLWQGGSLNTVGIDTSLYNYATGNLTPGGDGAVGTMTAYATGLTYSQAATANMTIDIKDDSTYDQIVWTGGTAEFEDGTTITLNLIDDDLSVLTMGQTFDILVADGITAGTFTLLGKYASSFSVNVIGGNVLQLKYGDIPEPAVSAGLLGALALALVARRRRK